MGVGALSALNTLQANLMVILVTGPSAWSALMPLAGYGIASRLDHVLIQFIFALGTAVVTMVGVNVGAGNTDSAKRVVWFSRAR
ncbi:MATE family efflux transporter [Microvirga sp. VF16]|uniref:MATE family efflux transporter n=1 Tax=Microvirga sp. VF16 TaxID=2807101 RepID=UPI00193E0DF5|nr:MATE family efflux transporter [Microvirga sp. VF16]QRM34711.1 hypothetical protein JO965_41290 [Microvirga sp. VF16]